MVASRNMPQAPAFTTEGDAMTSSVRTRAATAHRAPDPRDPKDRHDERGVPDGATTGRFADGLEARTLEELRRSRMGRRRSPTGSDDHAVRRSSPADPSWRS
jgi:hypothetical protein